MGLRIVSASPAGQRGKILVAVVLGILLLAVLGWTGEEPEDSITDTGTPTPLSSQRPATATPTPGVAPQAGEQAVELRLPRVDIQRVQARNPFSGARTAASSVGPADPNSPIEKAWSVTSSFARRIAQSLRPAARDQGQPATSPEGSPQTATESSSAETLRVSAIVTGGRRPAALIGDRLFYENDTIDNRWQVTTIHSRGVIVLPVAALAAPRE